MNRSKIIASILTACVVVAGHSTGTGAYSSSGYQWASWPVPFYVNPSNADVSSSAAVSAVQAGMAAWNTQSGTTFRFSYGGQVNDTATSVDGRNVIIFRNSSNPDSATAIATTYTWIKNGSRYDSDIVFWDGAYALFTGSTGCTSVNGQYGAYIEDVATHELGHSFGLAHSSATDATMYASYTPCSTWMRTLSADDVAGAQALYPSSNSNTSNTAPTVTISSPANSTSVPGGSLITFSGSASDTQDGTLTGSLVWYSNIEGQIGTGGSFARTLTAGNHTITTTVSDSGALTTQQSISVNVGSATTNSAPSVTITSPANGASYAAGASVTFTASASDTQDGNLTNAIVWRSSIDGQFGTGGSVTRALTSGTHTITATVSDSGALIAQRSVSVTVAASAPTQPSPQTSTSPTLTVRAYKVKGVQTADLAWANLTATSVDVYRNGSMIKTVSNTGSVTDKIGQKGSGSYSYKVCAAGTSTCSNQVTASF